MRIDIEKLPASVRGFAPFGGAALLAWVTVPIGSQVEWSQYALASALFAISVVPRLLPLPWLARRGLTGVPPTLLFLAALGLLRNSAGGINAGVGVIAMVPVFYIALHRQATRDLYVILAGVALFYLAPIILVGPPAYPHTQYRTALLSVAISTIVGLATRRLVAESRRREQMLQGVGNVMRDLYSSSQGRLDVCEAVKRIGEATCAIIYEPIVGSKSMHSTAIVGIDADHIEIPADRPTAVTEAYLSGQSILLTENLPSRVGNPELWRAAGSPSSVLYQPLMRGSESLGVLVVGWRGAVRTAAPRVIVVEMLAHEAAAVIHRADMMTRLSGMAQTDPLTGLANRRAWDVHVKQALEEGRRFAIAMLDFDHFKQYNDTRGHPAGDRLLKETAVMWQHHIRTGDLLARLGGEEFGVLLLDCETNDAVEVIERLRSSVYSDRTCSAGFAERQTGEPIHAVMARADKALYEAKRSGRDRICASVQPRVPLISAQ